MKIKGFVFSQGKSGEKKDFLTHEGSLEFFRPPRWYKVKERYEMSGLAKMIRFSKIW